jgi:hypothetical protein
MGQENVATNSKIDAFVSGSHIVVFLAYTTCQFFAAYVKPTLHLKRSERASIADYCLAGVADVFLSLMLWFIIDNEKSVTVVVDGERVYAVLDVIKPSHSGINEHCDLENEDEDPDEISTRQVSYSLTSVSKRMID